MVEKGFQPITDPALDPLMIVTDADRLGGAVGGGDALDLAQDARGARRDRLLDQLLLAIEQDLVGAPCRGHHRDEEADDRDRNDHADGHDQAQPRLVPTRPAVVLGDLRSRRSNHAPTMAVFLFAPTIG